MIPDRLRQIVVNRAGDRCEYCLLPSIGQVATFPADHIKPRDQGGETVVENLALSCPHCNAHKWAFAEGVDPLTGGLARLFNPRIDSWNVHFRVSGFTIEGLTPEGRVTVARLQINAPEMQAARRLLHELGLWTT
jgi:hypothetical protein